MEGLAVSTDLPRRQPSRTASLSPSSAWSVVSKSFQSKPKLSSVLMSTWIEKQNEDTFAENRRIFYVPGLTSMVNSSQALCTPLPSSDKWDFKGISELTVNTHMPATSSELDLRREMDFWDTVVPDKSPRPKEGETPVVADWPEVLFDASEDTREGQEGGSDDGLTHTTKLEPIPPGPLCPADADHTTGNHPTILGGRMVFQLQATPNPHVSATQPRRVLLSRAWSCCGIRPVKATEVLGE